MYEFHVVVQMRPDSVRKGVEIDLEGREFTPLEACGPLKPVAMPISFEWTADRLQQLPRLFFEPDGSFVWVGQDGGQRWQVDGQLTDRDGSLLYAELRGCCSVAALDRLLGTLGWPGTPLIFQLTRHAVFLDEDEFRRYAANPRK